jgi:hypothetical protein
MVVLIKPSADDRLIVRFAYNDTVRTTLKETVPYLYREYDPSTKTWYVDADWGDAVIAAMQAIGMAVSDQRPVMAREPHVSPLLQGACQALYITPDAPVQVAEAAYKALARLHHPDVGGDVETMQALNDAIETFKVYTEVPF